MYIYIFTYVCKCIHILEGYTPSWYWLALGKEEDWCICVKENAHLLFYTLLYIAWFLLTMNIYYFYNCQHGLHRRNTYS